MNILSNAIDALDAAAPLPEAGQIRISTEINRQDQIKIVIADNGPGIPASIQQKIFDPFFTTKSVGQGTGLGLAISYQIISEKHDGSLNCISAAEQGTQFIIQMPIKLIGS